MRILIGIGLPLVSDCSGKIHEGIVAFFELGSEGLVDGDEAC